MTFKKIKIKEVKIKKKKKKSGEGERRAPSVQEEEQGGSSVDGNQLGCEGSQMTVEESSTRQSSSVTPNEAPCQMLCTHAQLLSRV